MNIVDLRARLTKAEKAGDLEKQLAQADEGVPWNGFVWVLQFPAFLGAGIHVIRMADNAVAGDTGPPAEELVWLAVLLLIATAMRFFHPLLLNNTQKLRQRVRKKGLVVPAAIVQANSMWGEVDEWVFGGVLISFDPAVFDQPELLTKAAENVFALKHVDRSTLPKEQRPVAWNLYHELAPIRSIEIPESLTPGLSKCIMAGVLLPPKPLREGPLLFALALPDNLDPHAIAILPEDV